MTIYLLINGVTIQNERVTHFLYNKIPDPLTRGYKRLFNDCNCDVKRINVSVTVI